MFDAVIVGGGPAGLNAALVLARCGRRVIVIDAGRPRNYAAVRMHNYLTLNGIRPATFRARAVREVVRHGVVLTSDLAVRARRLKDGFVIDTRRGERLQGRAVLVATGVCDELPAIQNFAAFYGRGVHHCPYCDGTQYRGKPLAAYGDPKAAVGLALSLLTWTPEVHVVTDGLPLTPSLRKRAKLFGLNVHEAGVARLVSRRRQNAPSRGDPFGGLELANGETVRVAGMFFNTGRVQRCNLPAKLGCLLDEEGRVVHDRKQRTGVPGLFLAGDASMDVQFVIVAAAEGAKAGVAMNRYLQELDRAPIESLLSAGPTRRVGG